MDFETAAKLGSLFPKHMRRSMFELLVTYRDISASEAASRLNLHIRTVQDFLESLTELGITSRQEVRENKRPYFRYTLEQQHIRSTLILTAFKKNKNRMNFHSASVNVHGLARGLSLHAVITPSAMSRSGLAMDETVKSIK